MTNQQIINSFFAFNVNAWENLIYVFQSNLWLIIIAFSAVVMTILSLKEEIEDVVTEEQNIL